LTAKGEACLPIFLSCRCFDVRLLQLAYGVNTPWTKQTYFVAFSPFAKPKPKPQKKNDAMNTKNRSYEPEYATTNSAAVKTVNLQVAVTEPDLKKAVREAFILAKSGGRELNLAFSLQSFAQTMPKPSGVRAARLAAP
jgi:hypothetical protein